MAAQYRHLNGCDPGAGETEGMGRGGTTERSKSREGGQEGTMRAGGQRQIQVLGDLGSPEATASGALDSGYICLC